MKVMSILFWVLVICFCCFFIGWNIYKIVQRIKEKKNKK